MSTKIQINSLEALERLIGGDTEFEMEIRDSVVSAFTKKHLKDLANADLMKTIGEAIKNEITSEFFQTIKHPTNSYSTMTVFRKDVIDELKLTLQNTARKELTEIVSAAVEEQKAYEIIIAQLESTTSWITSRLAPDVLERRLNAMVDKKIKEKLGL